MSLTGALSSAVSALAAQSQSLAMIGDNIANADTTGYKTTSPLFEDLVTASGSAKSYSSGGVSVLSRANITQQGLLAATSNATDVAILGAGFFVVSSAATGGTTSFTRNGAFSPDKDGLLENDGFFLEGWRTDTSGNVIGGEIANNLSPINTEVAPTSASATTKTSIAANLPADAANAATFNSSMTVFDSLGTPSNINITWTKTGANTWTAAFADPQSPSAAAGSTATTGQVTGGGTVTIQFDNATGAVASVTPNGPLTIGNWSDGAADSSIALDFTGMTQFASGEATPTMGKANIESNGFALGTLSSVTVGKDGVVSSTYSNGQSVPIYKIAVATFNDPTGLAAHSDGMYTATATSGNAAYQTSGENGAGTVFGSELESSTTDTSGQFSNMISAQQAYSAASQVITTVSKMFDTLMSSMR